jgi:predicted nucleic acid-binding protein
MSGRLPEAVLLDTSVLLRFFHHHDDELQPRALALREAFLDRKVALILLDLSIYEVINVLVRRLTRSAARLRKDVHALFALETPIYAVDTALATETAAIASATNLSGYDAAFLAASRLLAVPLVTADQHLLDASKGDGVIALASVAT